MAHPADTVFHTLELAQQIVHYLQEKDLFTALRITKALWESKEPVSAWREYIRRFGYKDNFIDQYADRYHLRDIYHRICRSCDAVSRGTKPKCKRIDLREEVPDNRLVSMGNQDVHYIFRQCKRDGTDVYTLDFEGAHLMYRQPSIWPLRCFDNPPRFLGCEGGQVVARNVKDWSLSGSFGDWYLLQDWWTQGRHVLGYYQVQEGDEETTIFEVWDAHGVKRGELIHPEGGRMVRDAEDLGENLMATETERQIKVWDLETLKCVYEYTVPEEDPYAMVHLYQNVIIYTPRVGLRFTEFWTTDGSPITKARAELVTHAQKLWCKFSDGTMVTYPWDLTLCDQEGAELYARYYSSEEHEPFKLDAGILLDRFFFTVFNIIDFGEGDSVVRPAELRIYAKDGEELGSQILNKGDRNHRWFVDIFGRLVFLYLNPRDSVEELEVVDFCRWVKVAKRKD
ncbi:hypothetical protein N0V84_002890 [Fusarium piperis]|uniref:Uncharacterized protein n=1 Tax=Fusarium piperis TaxID=1435070 RepID=A0A9W8WIU4_9HYPO|nr:hypothetical protein N0V84_002890 [Fusarium piperis]